MILGRYPLGITKQNIYILKIGVCVLHLQPWDSLESGPRSAPPRVSPYSCKHGLGLHALPYTLQ